MNLNATGRRAWISEHEPITTGSVGIQVEFAFSDEWDGLARIAVFQAGEASVDVALTADRCAVPPEVLTTAGQTLQIGVYGTDGETMVIPTVYAVAGLILKGAEPSGLDPEIFTPSLAEQVLAAAEEAVETANSVREDADAGAFVGPPGEPGAYDVHLAWDDDFEWRDDIGHDIHYGATVTDKTWEEITEAAFGGKHVQLIDEDGFVYNHLRDGTTSPRLGNDALYFWGLDTDDLLVGAASKPMYRWIRLDCVGADEPAMRGAGGQIDLASADDLENKLDVDQGASNAGKFLAVGPDGIVTPEDNRFVVNLTPTAADFSGVMNRTCAEITAAYEAGKDIWLDVDATALGYEMWKVKATIEAKVSGENYGQVMGFLINLQLSPPSIIFIWTEFGNADENRYSTRIFPLATGQ